MSSRTLWFIVLGVAWVSCAIVGVVAKDVSAMTAPGTLTFFTGLYYAFKD